MSGKRKSSKRRKKPAKGLIIFTIVLVVIVAVAAVAVYFIKPELYHIYLGLGEHSYGEYVVTQKETCGKSGTKMRTCSVCGERDEVTIPATGNHTYDGDICTVCGYDKSSPIGTADGVTSSELSIHFISFDSDAAGDSTLIKYGNTEILIDAGPDQKGATTIKNYVDKYCTDGKLEYVIATHADQDHIAGLVGTSSNSAYNGILYSYEIGTIIRFDKTNKEETTESGNDTLYKKFLNAVDYAVGNGTTVYTASQCWYGSDGAQKTYYLDSEETVSINILYNYYYEHTSSDENNYSVCMLLTQETSSGESNNYLFTGDLEKEGEEYLVKNNTLPEVELFKAGHHGSPTSSNTCLLSVIKPKYVAVCCCAGTDEYSKIAENQFPSQDFIDRVAPYTDSVFVTNVVSDNTDGYEAMNGNIIFYTEASGKLKYYCTNNTTKLKDTEWFKANRTCPKAWS